MFKHTFLTKFTTFKDYF